MDFFRWPILWINYDETCHELEDSQLFSNNALCEQGLNNQGTKPKKITKVIVAGFILACITLLDGIASSYAYAAAQTADITHESLSDSELHIDKPHTVISEQESVPIASAIQPATVQAQAQIVSVSTDVAEIPISLEPAKINPPQVSTNTTLLPELPIIAEPDSLVVAPEELVTPEPESANNDVQLSPFSDALVDQDTANTSNEGNEEGNNQAIVSSVRSSDDKAKPISSSHPSNASIAVNSHSLPEEAIPQMRVLSPALASPRSTIEDITVEETIAIATDNAAIPPVRVLSPSSVSSGSTDAHFRSEADSSIAKAAITQSASTVTLPEGAISATTVLTPQSSPQPLQIKVSTEDSRVNDFSQVESVSVNNDLNGDAAIAFNIDILTEGTEADLGNLAQDNGASIFESTDGNIGATIAPLDLPPQDVLPIEPETEPEVIPFETPPTDELLEPSETPSQPELPTEEVVFSINRFDFLNNTAFDDDALQQVTAEFLGENQTFVDVAAAREAVTKLYVDNGYATSGAILPPQSVTDGQVQIEIIEGQLDDIVVKGTRRLRSGYISSRIAVGTEPPLNVNRLVERLQLLQADPLVQSISADLQTGTEPGTNTLVVSVAEADSFGMTYTLDNNRSPSVGTVRHQLQASEGNLLGFGDRLTVDYTLTSGSDGLDVDYTVPLSPYGTSLGLAFNTSDNEVIEDPFDVLDIDSDTEAYELTLRHPLKQTPTQELAIGLTGSYQRTQTFLGFDDIGPFPLSPGADSEGRTKVSTLRFFQEWTHRSPKQVLALRSQFNLGLDALDATINDDAPDSRFFSWQGQAQWVNVLAPDTLLLLKGTAQLADDSLLTVEQLSLGGQSSVRGYRQNFLSTDSGVSASAELRFPISRERSSDTLVQLAPFVDAGYGWNVADSSPEPIVGAGLGLLFRQQEFSARLDWGIPLINADNDRDSLQESGVYFSMRYSFF